MLEPRETDLFSLFLVLAVLSLVLAVLSLVIYIFLGKCSEATKKKERISFLAELAAEEALREEAMTAVIPFVPALKNVIHECARCNNPATTRCSQCKSVHYCSGKCQIIHWRQSHKHECQQLEANSCSSLPVAVSNEQSVCESFLHNDKKSSESSGYEIKYPVQEKAVTDDRIYHSTSPAAYAAAACTSINTYGVPMSERRSTDRQIFCKSKLRRDDGAVIDSTDVASQSRIASSTSTNKKSYMRHKLRNSVPVLSEGKTPRKPDVNICDGSVNGQTSWRSAMHDTHDLPIQNGSILDSRTSLVIAGLLSSAKPGVIVSDIERDFMSGGGNFLGEGITFSDETVDSSYSSDMTSMKKGIKEKSASHPSGTKMHKSQKKTMKVAKERLCSETERNGQIADGSNGSNGASSMGNARMIGLRKPSRLGRWEASEVVEEHNKLNMLFPYEEFVKFFQYEDFNLSPRGLINCGNSCYANAVLQCLTYTKPLTIYFLRSLHSRACRTKDWCLMCELEQHVMMLRDCGGLLSAGRILSHMRSINCQIGDGNQEDAHEFLRILVTSMQSISLEGFGGENTVDPRLQETTFIQHTFGGCLKSKVNCLRCHHESERYENIMDLTLEIFGWVESLEDALTQFTNPEDLDGENMYRCGRCAAYVRATKQLSIQEAPNILTIVLKRFQEGSYGKINKCITFPDMLDMVPFMTGTDDIPPLYILYAIVVHMDTLNASFLGHYISYVTDLQGSWFRVDDTEVQPVPISQVMSERAYILFYKRSCPRPASWKHIRNQPPGFVKHRTSKNHTSSRPGQSKSSGIFVSSEPSSNHRSDQNSCGMVRSVNRSRLSSMEFSDTIANDRSLFTSSDEASSMEFSDAIASDCSFFTSSDEASFTTESTRDSFSTVDYADAACNTDPISSIFSTKHRPKSSSTQPLNRVQKVDNVKAVTGPSTKAFLSDRNCGFNTKFGSNLNEITRQASDHFIL